MSDDNCRSGWQARRWAVVFAISLVGALVAGCGGREDGAVDTPASAPPSAVPAHRVDRQLVQVADAYVGRIADSDALVAVTINDGVVRAYVCDGNGTDAREIAQWFEGRWDGESAVTLTGGPFQLTLMPDGNGIAGHLTTADGKQLPFHAALPTSESDGLYETRLLDPTTGSPRAEGHTIVIGPDERGVIIPPQTVCFIRLKTIVLADGTTTQVPVEICRGTIG